MNAGAIAVINIKDLEEQFRKKGIRLHESVLPSIFSFKGIPVVVDNTLKSGEVKLVKTGEGS